MLISGKPTKPQEEPPVQKPKGTQNTDAGFVVIL